MRFFQPFLRYAHRERWLLPLVFALAHVAIFAALFRGIYSMPFSGTGLYYTYAGKTLAGAMPYRDFLLEYPPLALVFFTLPRVLGESFRWYYVWFQVEIVLCDLVILFTLSLAATRWKLPLARVLAAYTIALLAVGPISLHQYDLFPAAFALAAVVAFAAERQISAAVLLALGVMTKVYPVLIAPLFVLVEWRRGRVRRLWRPATAFAATCAAVASPWLLLAPRSLGVFFSYHARRGIHVDSTYGTIALAANAAWGAIANVIVAFGSWNVDGPLPTALARVSNVALAIVLAGVYVLFDRRLRADADGAAVDVAFLSQAAALVVVAALPASKVLSPQYLIWVAPLLPLLAVRRRTASWSVFAVAGILTYFMYPFHYESLLARDDWAIAVMGFRNALLVVLAGLLATSLRRHGEKHHNQFTHVRNSEWKAISR